ncbi:hypothetical protein AVEN_160987-1 [Araneus ventricosus]|uniref:Uncharacterized protein n=1 Tax=Araneus ventricosus TaxID=182803 RepID=A0A4Y2QVE8_ARAVE|nr:hypothetical protein AVEN_250192-1 [Araneus ventricosus]GBN67332.1 hypothetical protein AVEN_160987-1 [Araneus ventricosus]
MLFAALVDIDVDDASGNIVHIAGKSEFPMLRKKRQYKNRNGDDCVTSIFCDASKIGTVLSDDDILTEVPIDNVNDIIQMHMNKDSSDGDECNINQNISDKEELYIKSYVSFLDTVPKLEKFAISQGYAEILELLMNIKGAKNYS